MSGTDEELVDETVTVAVQQHAVGGAAVPASAPRLLVIRLQRARHLEVNHAANVGLVDPHAERVRRDHDPKLSPCPRGLDSRAPLAAETGVVGRRVDPGATQELGRRLGHLAGRAVDEGGAVTRAQQLDQLPALLRQPLLAADGPAQVRPVESPHNDARASEVELAHDVLPRLGRRRRRQGEERRPAEPGPELAQPQVAGPEVVTPLADAVCLVDRDEPDPHLAERPEERRAGEPLRSDVEQLELTGDRLAEPRADLGARQRAVDQRGRDVAALERVHLVAHQGDEGRDDERQAGEQEGRHLIAERFSTAGRHHDQRVPAPEHRPDRRALTGPEPGVSEVALESGLGF